MPRKLALVVGINDYPGTGMDLSGCVNDARDWADVLKARGYAVDLRLDAEATSAKIIQALSALMRVSGPGDQLAFTFSGHGSWIPDRNGDEIDGRDEVLCAHDVMDGGILADDDLDYTFKQKHPDAELMMIADSCHSGTAIRFSLSGSEPKEVARPRFLPPGHFLSDPDPVLRTVALERAIPKRTPAHVALLLAGCRDDEYSYDAWFNGRPNGAMTRVAIDALKISPESASAWLRAIRKKLPSRAYPQTPQLTGMKRMKAGDVL